MTVGGPLCLLVIETLPIWGRWVHTKGHHLKPADTPCLSICLLTEVSLLTEVVRVEGTGLVPQPEGSSHWNLLSSACLFDWQARINNFTHPWVILQHLPLWNLPSEAS